MILALRLLNLRCNLRREWISLFGGADISAAPVTNTSSAAASLDDLFGTPTYTCYEKNGLVITLKPTRSGTSIDVEAVFRNVGAGVIDGLVFQVAVPKSLKLRMDAPSGNMLVAGGEERMRLAIENPGALRLDSD